MYEVTSARMPDGEPGYAVVSSEEHKARGIFRIKQDAESFLHLIQEPDLADMIDRLWARGNKIQDSKEKR